jgi:hypothetical protein
MDAVEAQVGGDGFARTRLIVLGGSVGRDPGDVEHVLRGGIGQFGALERGRVGITELAGGDPIPGASAYPALAVHRALAHDRHGETRIEIAIGGIVVDAVEIREPRRSLLSHEVVAIGEPVVGARRGGGERLVGGDRSPVGADPRERTDEEPATAASRATLGPKEGEARVG